MEKQIKKYQLIGATFLFIGFPVLLWGIGNIPKRSFLKEAISLLTLVSFFLMLAQFYLTRINKKTLKIHHMSRVLNIHKIIGYIFIPILLLHPFLIVLPRYFESGTEPSDAFITIISTYNQTGVLLGITAWCLMLILGISSLFRNRLGISYKAWRIFHGLISTAFIIIASWHAIELGRHTNLNMSALIIVLAGIGILTLMKSYLINRRKKR